MTATAAVPAGVAAGGAGGRFGGRVATVAAANVAVAGLGFLGSGILLPHALDVRAFAAVSLFLAACQFLQDAFGRSLNWAVVRLCPVAERERPGGGASMLAAARVLQHWLAVGGVLATALGAWLLQSWQDPTGERSRAALLVWAAVAAACAVQCQFGFGVLQLRQRFAALAGWMAAHSGLRVLAWTLLLAAGVLDLTTAIGAHIGTSLLLWWSLRRATRDGAGSQAVIAAQPAADRRRLLRLGASMAIATTLASLAAQVDLFLLDGNADDVATARLRIAVLFATAIELATSAVMTALLPEAGSAHGAVAQQRALRRGLGWGTLVAVAAVLSLPVVSFALPLLLPQYAAAAELYPILLIGVVATAITDPMGLLFLSRDRAHRFVVLNALLLAVVVGGNLLVPGDDRALVAAEVRSAGRLVLAVGILTLLWRDLRAARRHGQEPQKDT